MWGFGDPLALCRLSADGSTCGLRPSCPWGLFSKLGGWGPGAGTGSLGSFPMIDSWKGVGQDGPHTGWATKDSIPGRDGSETAPALPAARGGQSPGQGGPPLATSSRRTRGASRVSSVWLGSGEARWLPAQPPGGQARRVPTLAWPALLTAMSPLEGRGVMAGRGMLALGLVSPPSVPGAQQAVTHVPTPAVPVPCCPCSLPSRFPVIPGFTGSRGPEPAPGPPSVHCGRLLGRQPRPASRRLGASTAPPSGARCLAAVTSSQATGFPGPAGGAQGRFLRGPGRAGARPVFPGSHLPRTDTHLKGTAAVTHSGSHPTASPSHTPDLIALSGAVPTAPAVEMAGAWVLTGRPVGTCPSA